MDNVKQPGKLSTVFVEYVDDNPAPAKKKLKTKANLDTAQRLHYSSKQDLSEDSDDVNVIVPKQSSKMRMDSVPKTVQMKKNELYKMPSDRSQVLRHVEPLTIRISQNTKAPSRVSKPTKSKKAKSAKPIYVEDSDESSSSEDERKMVPKVSSSSHMDVDDSENNQEDTDDYMPALPVVPSSNLPRKTMYKKIIKVNKRTGEVISETKQILKRGIISGYES